MVTRSSPTAPEVGYRVRWKFAPKEPGVKYARGGSTMSMELSEEEARRIAADVRAHSDKIGAAWVIEIERWHRSLVDVERVP